jgi:hypothetical protein
VAEQDNSLEGRGSHGNDEKVVAVVTVRDEEQEEEHEADWESGHHKGKSLEHICTLVD